MKKWRTVVLAVLAAIGVLSQAGVLPPVVGPLVVAVGETLGTSSKS